MSLAKEIDFFSGHLHQDVHKFMFESSEMFGNLQKKKKKKKTQRVDYCLIHNQ